jgi:hypothetical protein
MNVVSWVENHTSYTLFMHNLGAFTLISLRRNKDKDSIRDKIIGTNMKFYMFLSYVTYYK